MTDFFNRLKSFFVKELHITMGFLLLILFIYITTKPFVLLSEYKLQSINEPYQEIVNKYSNVIQQELEPIDSSVGISELEYLYDSYFYWPSNKFQPAKFTDSEIRGIFESDKFQIQFSLNLDTATYLNIYNDIVLFSILKQRNPKAFPIELEVMLPKLFNVNSTTKSKIFAFQKEVNEIRKETVFWEKLLNELNYYTYDFSFRLIVIYYPFRYLIYLIVWYIKTSKKSWKKTFKDED